MDEVVLLAALHTRAGWIDTSLANVQTQRRGWTPLMIAAELGDLQLVEYLIEAGADPRRLDCRGWTALMWAVTRDRPAIVELFLGQNLPTQAEISASLSIGIKLSSSRCLEVFIRRVPTLARSMARFAIHVGNVSALRALARAGLVDYKTKSPGRSTTIRQLAKASGPAMWQAYIDGKESKRIKNVGLSVLIGEGKKCVAKVTTAALIVRPYTPWKALRRLIRPIKNNNNDDDDSIVLEWTNQIQFRGAHIVFPMMTVTTTSWMALEVCRQAAYSRCETMPFIVRLERLMMEQKVVVADVDDLIVAIRTCRDQLTVRQHELDRRRSLASSLRRSSSIDDAEWRRLQSQIAMCAHLIEVAADLSVGKRRGRIRRTTPGDGDDDDGDDTTTCVACLSGRKSFLTMPCRHLCFCGDCYRAREWERCPICNYPITEIIRIFL